MYPRKPLVLRTQSGSRSRRYLVQDNGKRTDTFGLREHKRFGEFAMVPMPPGMTTYASAYFTNMQLAQEEVAVITAYFYILIAFLFVAV